MKNKTLYFILLFSCINILHAQKLLPKDYLTPSFHQERRNLFKSKMPKNSIAIFMTNPVQNRANDVDYKYHQEPNFYYLTGYKEPNSLLILFSEKQNINNQWTDELIYVQERNPLQEQWNGYRLGVEGVQQLLGFQFASVNNEFFNLKLDFSQYDKILWNLPVGAFTNNRHHAVDSYKIWQYLNQQIETKAKKNALDNQILRNILTSMRQIKTDEEMELLKKAARISAVGQIEVMKAIHPQMSEMEIQGIHEFVYRKYGSEFEGYPSIVGSGVNGCVLHYIENNKTQVGNELVLMDIGAEYHGYSADVTRTIPANGRFTKEQATLYHLVLKAQEAGIAQAKVGKTMADVDKAARDIINQGLKDLGIITHEKEGRRFFPHSTSHYLGLDVHDLGDYKAFQSNMVITVEPGIYIPMDCACDDKWKGIAIRIEDDIWITENGPLNLSKDAPKTITEIETLMKQSSVLKSYQLPKLDAL